MNRKSLLYPFKKPTVAVNRLLKSVTATHNSNKSQYNIFFGNHSKMLNKFNLKKFGGKNDIDFDGIINKRDCNPFSSMRQDFSPFRYNDKATNMSAAKRFGGKNLKGLKKIGSGRDRNVYALDKDKVLKVAKNPGGLTQNTSESNIEYLEMGKHYETGLDYTVMSHNEELSQGNKRKLANIRKHNRIIQDGNSGFINGQRDKRDVEIAIKSDLSREDSPMIKAGITNSVLDFDFNHEELFANRQWGEDSKGNLALNDGGALQDDVSLRRYRIKDFRQVANIDRAKLQPWQLTDWQETQNQRRQFRNKGNYKEGASLEKQDEWKNMSVLQRDMAREIFDDDDGDRVPNPYDCEPENTMAQDTFEWFKKKKHPETYIEDDEYPNVQSQSFREEQTQKHTVDKFDNYGEVKDYSGKKIGNAIIAADLVIPSGKTLTLAGLGVKKYIDKVRFIKTDEHDNRYKVPKLEIHSKGNTTWKPQHKGASVYKQQQWVVMNKHQRNIERQRLNDADGDRVPDDYDCEIDNVMAQDSYQTLWHAGNIPPSETLQKEGRVFGFSSKQYAEGWKEKHNKAKIYQFVTDKYIMDKKSYNRPIKNNKTKLSHNEYIATSVNTEEVIKDIN